MRAALPLLLLSGCVLPAFDTLGPLRCDVDAGHGCLTGEACVAGLCVVPDPPQPGREIRVTTVPELRAAMAAATPGDVIVAAAGTYRLTEALVATAAGTASQRIVVRSETRLAAVLESTAGHAIDVQAPFWTFDGLEVRAICPLPIECEQGITLFPSASDTLLTRLRVSDFLMLISGTGVKQGTGVEAPHRTVIEASELFDSVPRPTAGKRVTAISIEAADDVVVRDCLIRDIGKEGTDEVTYSASLRGGGKRGRFERNWVLCDSRGQPPGNLRLGLSFGSGGTGPEYCAPAFNPATPCDVEQLDGVMQNNIVANCNDVGIYVNRGRNTSLAHNTLVATAGIDFRWDTTTGVIGGNLLQGTISLRDGATASVSMNEEGLPDDTFDTAYANPVRGDLRLLTPPSRWAGSVSRRYGVSDDFCGRARPAGNATAGALEQTLGSCETRKPPP